MSETTWLSTLYKQFRKELFLTAWGVLRQPDLAEDAIQAAFVKLVKLKSPPLDPKLYVFRSVRNSAIDLAKARSRRREESLQSEWDVPAPETDQHEADISQSVAHALERLDASSREVIELHLHVGLTFREIGEMLEEPLVTVASRYRRALKKIGKETKVHYE